MPDPQHEPGALLDALDPEQRRVAEALRGPVRVLAGAGTGKTRAITHRIAYGVLSGVHQPQRVLAVTFTARAAGEMRTRLRDLGVGGVQARTFHAASLRQLHYFWPQAVGGAAPEVMPHKASAVAEAAAAVLRERTGVERHDVALVLGSGWGQTGDLIGETLATIENPDVPGFGKAAVAGHSGVMRSVAIGDSGRRALVYGTRTHYYEGEGVRPVVHGIRTAAAAGCRTVVITNGCGGLRPEWAPGTPVLISDHINLTATSPIEGPTFVDLTEVYSPRLRAIAKDVDPTLDEGVYCQFRGPHYETPAEVQMARILGGHIVGMSTALEAIAARQAGMEILGFSLITNLAAGIQTTPLSHDEVLEAGREAEPVISRLLARVIEAL